MDLLTLLSHPMSRKKLERSLTLKTMSRLYFVTLKIYRKNKLSKCSSPMLEACRNLSNESNKTPRGELRLTLFSPAPAVPDPGYQDSRTPEMGAEMNSGSGPGVYGLATKTVTCILAPMDTAHSSSRARSMRSECDTRV